MARLSRASIGRSARSDPNAAGGAESGYRFSAVLFEDELYAAAGQVVVTGARLEEDVFWLFWLLIDPVTPVPGQEQSARWQFSRVMKEIRRRLDSLPDEVRVDVAAWLDLTEAAFAERHRIVHTAVWQTHDHATGVSGHLGRRFRDGVLGTSDVSIQDMRRVAAMLETQLAHGLTALVRVEKALGG
jgi:hypothetical protein